MRKFYKLRHDYLSDYGIQKTPKLDHELRNGRAVYAQNMPALEFEMDYPKDEIMPHYLVGGCCVMSKLLVATLKNAGHIAMETFPAILINPEEGYKRGDYLSCSILTKLRAVDTKRSDFDVIMHGDPSGTIPPLYGMHTIILKNDAIAADIDIFCLQESPSDIIISQKMVTALDANRPKEGWRLYVVELEVS